MLALVLLALLSLAPGARAASPYIWDEDTDGLDDRLETVNLLGYSYSFENADTNGRQRVLVSETPGGLVYGVYVIYDHTPTGSDRTALTALGMPVMHQLEALPVVRSAGTWAQVLLARSSLSGVERIEAVPVIYPLLYENAAAVAVRDASERVFPTWEGTGGADGSGVVIAFLDSGINDEAEGGWPGHESVAGRCSGGATFLSGDAAGDTPMNSSVNPNDHGGLATSSHGTHVAGIALGSGGPAGFARGIAPGAHFVDVKVLNDAGVGSGLPEALDWCIHNRNRNWGTPGYSGIQVINLSLSTPDSSDGNDVAAKLAAKAVELGIVVVASMGNDGLDHHVPSPASGDGVIAVGAYDSQRTPGAADDQFSSFSNRGPRADDGDGDALDELKPDLIAPGLSVLSADGDETTDGHQYRRLSGTSMSAGFVSGAAARLLSAYPGLTPAAVATLLRATAWRGTAGLPSGPAGADVRWQAARGFGALDLYAARLEQDQPDRSQVTRLELTATAAGGIDATLSTQRERGAAYFAIERAPDLGGVAGTYAGYDSAAAAGDSSLADATNRTLYPRSWSVPVGERGQAFWYRAAWTEGGVRTTSPARRFVSPSGASVATVEVTVVHNAYDHDLTGELVAGEAGNASGTQYGILPGSSAAVATDWVDGLSTLGNVSWTFRIEVTDPAAVALLPPSNITPWKLHVHEAGFLNRTGRVTDFRLTWHREDGDLVFIGGPSPQPTIEGQEAVVAMPQGTAGVESDTRTGLRYGPNPIRSGGVVTFVIPAGAGSELRIFDLAGREVARVPTVVADGVARAQWRTIDAHGGAIPPGIYLARSGAAPAMRIAVLR